MPSGDRTGHSDFAVVALLDALGTKGLLSRSAPDGLLETWQTLLSDLERLCDGATASEHVNDCSLLAFSDTVLISIFPVSEADQPICLSLLLDLLRGILWSGLLAGVFFRGAVSSGRFIQSPYRVLGESLEEAASWYEQADWMGIMATPNAAHLIDQGILDGWNVEDRLVRYDVPLHGRSTFSTWAVNWPTFAEDEATKEGTMARVKLLRSFRTYSGAIGPAVAAKYANTLAFADMVWKSTDT